MGKTRSKFWELLISGHLLDIHKDVKVRLWYIYLEFRKGV
jgi:hypothetical protein